MKRLLYINLLFVIASVIMIAGGNLIIHASDDASVKYSGMTIMAIGFVMLILIMISNIYARP